MALRRILKIVHTLGAAGMMGGMAACLVMLGVAHARPPQEVVVVYASLDLVTRWLILPSSPLCLVSGLLALAFHEPFHNAGWVWTKAATGAITLEGTFGLSGNAHDLAVLSARALEATPAQAVTTLDALARSERGALWALIVVGAANVILGVWRPRFRRDGRAGRSVPERSA